MTTRVARRRRGSSGSTCGRRTSAAPSCSRTRRAARSTSRRAAEPTAPRREWAALGTRTPRATLSTTSRGSIAWPGTYLPGNAWLDSWVPVNTNVSGGTCNASWNGTSASFYRSGGGCGNSGEIRSILLHEWGHGLDDNTGGSSSDPATSEALGDTVAYLTTHGSCIGRTLKQGVNCPNCNGCDGVRDVSAFALGSASVAKASSAKDDAGMNCDVYACNTAFHGPLGYEGHCESYIASTANRDLLGACSRSTAPTRAKAAWRASGTQASFPARAPTAWQKAAPTATPQPARTDASPTTGTPSIWPSTTTTGTWRTARLTPVASGRALNAHGIACGAQPSVHRQPTAPDAGSDADSAADCHGDADTGPRRPCRRRLRSHSTPTAPDARFRGRS